MTWRTVVEWLVLGAIWGASFLFARVAVPEFGAVPLVGVRLVVAALALSVPLLMGGHARLIRERWRVLLLVGALNSAIPFSLFAWSLRSLSAGEASVLNATAALFAGLIAAVVLGEHLSRRRTLGLVIGFVGVVLLVWHKLSFSGNLLALGAGLAAAFLYGAASHIITRKLPGVAPVAVSGGSLAFASLLILPLALASAPAAVPSLKAWGAALLLGVLCTAAGYLMYFRLVKSIGPTRAITVTYAIPAFGILWGHLFLNEPVSMLMLLGGAVIVVGTAMVKLPDRVRVSEQDAVVPAKPMMNQDARAERSV
ncbi:MAG: DMT family transporter [Phycisphaerales bacterium]|nr:DMT family transporter [Phycisphaerales bacterium]